jgi:hypothetical protein
MGAQQSSNIYQYDIKRTRHFQFDWYFTPQALGNARIHKEKAFLADLDDYGMLSNESFDDDDPRELSKMCVLCNHSDLIYMYALLSSINNTCSILMSNRSLQLMTDWDSTQPGFWVYRYPEEQESISFIPNLRKAIAERNPDVIVFPVALSMIDGSMGHQCYVQCDARTGNIYVFDSNGEDTLDARIIYSYIVSRVTPVLDASYNALSTTQRQQRPVFVIVPPSYSALQSRLHLHRIDAITQKIIDVNCTVYTWIVMFLSLLNDTNPYVVARDLASTFQQTALDVQRNTASIVLEMAQYLDTDPVYLSADAEQKAMLEEKERFRLDAKYKDLKHTSLAVLRNNPIAQDFAQLGLDHLINIASVNIARETSRYLYDENKSRLTREQATEIMQGNVCIQRPLYNNEMFDFLRFWFSTEPKYIFSDMEVVHEDFKF